MNEYELLYVISPRLTAEEVDGVVERVGALIEGAGGSISLVDNWGRRRLAYPIEHHFEGTYVLTHMTLPGERTAEIERALHLDETVLRHIVIRGVIPGYEGAPEQEVMEARRPAARPGMDERPPAEAGPAEGEPSTNEVAAPAEGAPPAEETAAPAEEAPSESVPVEATLAEPAESAPAVGSAEAAPAADAPVEEPPREAAPDEVPSPAPAGAE